MKRFFSFLLIAALLFSLSAAPAAAAEPSELSVEVQSGISARDYARAFGGDDSYQVSDLQLLKSGDLLVTCAAETAATLRVALWDDRDGALLSAAELPVEPGTADVTVTLPEARYPAFFRLTAQLFDGGEPLSNLYTNYDHTQEYQSFLAVKPDDPLFRDQTVLRFGKDAEGRENFAVVREDVRVIRVEDTNALSVLRSGEEGSSVLSPSVSGTYLAKGSLAAQLRQMKAGDKLLLLPQDEQEQPLAMVVGSLRQRSGGVELTASEQGAALEDFYDFIRVHLLLHADTDDLVTDRADGDLCFLTGPDAELNETRGTVEGSVGTTVSFTAGGVTVTDTVEISAEIEVRLDASFKMVFILPVLDLRTFTVRTTLTAKNTFNIHASAGASLDRTVRIGVIPVADVAVIAFNIPVDLVFSAGYSAVFDFTATATAVQTIKGGYESGRVFCTSTQEVSTGRELRTEARAYVSLGIACGLNIRALGVINAGLYGEVGIRADAVAQSINSTATFRHTCTACLDVKIALYAKAYFDLKASFLDWELANYHKDAGETEQTLYQLYLSLNGGVWKMGEGFCPNKQYLVTVTVTDGTNGQPLKGATVSRLGTTGADGKVSGWLSNGYYNLEIKRGGYQDRNVQILVLNAPVSKTVKMAVEELGQAVTYSMELWYGFSDEERALHIEQDREEGILVTLSAPSDLRLLALYTIAGKQTEEIIFQLNGSTPRLDLSEVDDWIPIGSVSNPFRGEFDGGKFVLSGLHGAYAMFGALDGAAVHGLNLENAEIVSESGRIGALTALATNGTEIYDVAVSGSVSGGTAGGLAGELRDSAIRNSYSTAAVSGSVCAGGLVGSYAQPGGDAALANVYAAGTVSAPVCGMLCGSVTAEEAPASADAGIEYAYYLDGGLPAFGELAGGCAPVAYAFTEEQGRGVETGDRIGEGYADTPSLLLALNRWYAENGAYLRENMELDEDGIPAADPQDRYLRWYADGLDEDGSYANGGYPVLANRGRVFLLTVFYRYYDGREAYPTVKLYLEPGAEYDVDSYTIRGYYTLDLEYSGLMPDYDIDFYVTYYPELEYDGRGAELDAAAPAAPGAVYRIASAEDLEGLSAYTAAGGNTLGVRFVQTAAIDVSGRSWNGIGTEEQPFRGSYCGGLMELSGLGGALFRRTEEASLTEIRITGGNVSAAGDAALLALAAVDSELRDCAVSGVVRSEAGLAAGLVSVLERSLADHCVVDADVRGALGAGGIAAEATDSEIRNSVCAGACSGGGSVGGLAGKGLRSRFCNGYVTSAVGDSAGGLVGTMTGGELCGLYFAGTAAEAIAAAVESVRMKNLYYPDDTASAVAVAEAFSRSGDGAAALLAGLNGFVRARNSSELRTWAAHDGFEAQQDTDLPVLAQQYQNWITDLREEDGALCYTFDRARYESCRGLIAFYDASGKLLALRALDLTSDRIELPEQAYSSYKVFLTDDAYAPVERSVDWTTD